MTDQEATVTKSLCPLCSRECVLQDMLWSDVLDQPCCPDCLAEEESCGCSDD